MTVDTSKRLSPTDWAHIVTFYERGEKNLRELADQFGVSKQAISKGLKSRGIEKGSRLDEVMGEANDAAREERDRKVKQANQQQEQYAKWNDALVKMTMKKLIDGAQTPGGIAAANADVKTLKEGLAAVRIARQENWEILGIEDLLGENADLPDLNIGEYTPEELERIREANEESYLEGQDDDEDGFEEEDED